MSVYKYVRPERIDILEKSLIRFTQPAYFNDPFEMKPFVHSLASDRLLNSLSNSLTNDSSELKDMIESAIDLRLGEINAEELERGLKLDLMQYYSWAYPQRSDKEIRDYVNKKLLKFVHNNNVDHTSVKRFYTDTIIGILDANPQIQVNFTQYLSAYMIEMFNLMYPSVVTQLQQFCTYQIGVLSLSETVPVGKDEDGKNIVMWAHYTDNHAGFVIEFDDTHCFFDQRLNDHDMMRHLRHVEYSMVRPNITLIETDTGELDNEKLTNHFMVNFFYTKSRAWEYEKEVRMLLPLEAGQKLADSKEDIYLFSLPSDSLKGIYLGYKIQPNIRQKISELLKNDSRYSHVKLYQMSPDEKEFLLNVQTI